MDIKRKSTKHPKQVKDAKGGITHRLIKEFRREELSYERTGNYIVYWTVQWTNQQVPVWEKRRVYVSRKTGAETTYRQMGLTFEDLKWLGENYKEICESLRG